MKKKILLGLVFTLMLGVLAFNFYSEKKFVTADYHIYNSIEELKSSSPIIIVGSINNLKKSKEVNLTKDGSIKSKFSISEVVVEDVIKGDIKIGDTIKVKQSEEEETAKKVGYFKKDEKYILFLSTFDDIDPNIPASLMNPIQGQVLVDKDDRLVFNKDNIIKEFENIQLEEFLKKLKTN